MISPHFTTRAQRHLGELRARGERGDQAAVAAQVASSHPVLGTYTHVIVKGQHLNLAINRKVPRAISSAGAQTEDMCTHNIQPLSILGDQLRKIRALLSQLDLGRPAHS